MSDRAVALWTLAIGLFFAIHCSLATRREFRAGVAKGRMDHPRSTDPIGFWVVIAGNALAALLGAAFVGAALLELIGAIQ